MSAIERTLRVIVGLLVAKDYAALERLTRGVRLAAALIEQAVNEYGRTLEMPPADVFAQVDVVPIRGGLSGYSIRYRLYTREEGLSDLDIQATLFGDDGDDILIVELDDILVA
jgi:hypothetical protein